MSVRHGELDLLFQQEMAGGSICRQLPVGGDDEFIGIGQVFLIGLQDMQQYRRIGIPDLPIEIRQQHGGGQNA